MRLTTIVLVALSLLLGSCGGKKADEKPAAPVDSIPKTKTLVLYYSQTGATKEVAEEIRKQLGADIDSITATEPYNGDYDATIKRWEDERQKGKNPKINPLKVNVNDYDTIFFGFPIWGGTYALPVKTFLTDNSLEDKTIITFATFGSGGLEPATKDVAIAQPKSSVREGYGIRNARLKKAPEEINRFLIENGYKQGDIETLPEYDAPEAVNAATKAIFTKATAGYKYPLGSPVKVAKRTYKGTTDYKYDVKNLLKGGDQAFSIVYVTVDSVDNKPEFTRVVSNGIVKKENKTSK